MPNRIVSIFLGILAFFVAKYGVQEFFEYRNTSKNNNDIQQSFDKAIDDNPDLIATQAIQDEALKLANERLSSAKTDIQKRSIAAGLFIGFYDVNVRTRKDYCNNYDIDISEFVNEFAKANEYEYTAAKQILVQIGTNQEEVYSRSESTHYYIIDKDMHDIANGYQFTMPEACELFNEYASEIVSELLFSNANPDAYKILIEE